MILWQCPPSSRYINDATATVERHTPSRSPGYYKQVLNKAWPMRHISPGRTGSAGRGAITRRTCRHQRRRIPPSALGHPIARTRDPQPNIVGFWKLAAFIPLSVFYKLAIIWISGRSSFFGDVFRIWWYFLTNHESLVHGCSLRLNLVLTLIQCSRCPFLNVGSLKFCAHRAFSWKQNVQPNQTFITLAIFIWQEPRQEPFWWVLLSFVLKILEGFRRGWPKTMLIIIT